MLRNSNRVCVLNDTRENLMQIAIDFCFKDFSYNNHYLANLFKKEENQNYYIKRFTITIINKQ